MPPEHETLSLSKSSVLHIEDFPRIDQSGQIVEIKDKYFFLIGHQDAAVVMAFLVSSQEKYAKHSRLAREQVEIPLGTLKTLPKLSWIQCFHQAQRLRVADLHAGFQSLKVSYKGKLPDQFLQRVREVVRCSDVLSQYEMEDCLFAIDNDNTR